MNIRANKIFWIGFGFENVDPFITGKYSK